MGPRASTISGGVTEKVLDSLLGGVPYLIRESKVGISITSVRYTRFRVRPKLINIIYRAVFTYII
jgi:hypothetical protein